MYNIYIYIDDERSMDLRSVDILNTVYDLDIVDVVRDYNHAIRSIDLYANDPDFFMLIDFDHDLGEDKNGYDIAKYIVENEIKNVRYHVHSMNSVGRANIEQLLSHYGYKHY